VRTLSHVFFLDPSPVRRVPIQTGIQRELNFVSVRTIKGRSSSHVLHSPPPPLEHLCNRSCSNKTHTLPKELVGVIRGLANPGLRGVGHKVQLHTQPCLEFEVRQERRGGKDHGVSTSKIHFNADRKECDVCVDHLYTWTLREVEVWVLRVAPRQREEKKKHHGTLRDTIPASSRVLSLSPKGDTQWVYSVGLMFRSVRTNK
jgi:hypothetical protein